MLQLWPGNRSDEEYEEAISKYSKHWWTGNRKFNFQHIIRDAEIDQALIDEVEDLRPIKTKGFKYENPVKKFYEPGLRNGNRKNPQRERTWKRKRKNQYK